MILHKIKTRFRMLEKKLKKNPDQFLENISGVIHVGANTGQERDLYRAYGLSVVWIEPVPEVFIQLTDNIRGFENQCALQALVTDVDDKEYEFFIANNNGVSSSILELKQHKDIWPDIHYTQTLLQKSITLSSLLLREHIDVSKYQALIMDTQGSELLVLQGSLPILNNFTFIKTEVADFESYEGCCRFSDLNKFMIKHGYRQFSRVKFASRAKGGNYYDVVYKKQA